MSTTPEVAALQDVLAAEHAAVYVLGALGAQTSQSQQSALYARITSAFVVHRQRRDQLIATITGLSATPVAAEVAYQVPTDLSSPTRIEAAALRIERGCASAYAYAVANSSGSGRVWQIAALLDSAAREIGFGGTPETLPGL